MKTIQCLMVAAMSVSAAWAGENWRKVAFIGDAKVMRITGLVEVLEPSTRILHDGEKAKAGETFRIWKGAELILQMENSKSLVRAQGPVLLRLAPEKEGFNRASITSEEKGSGFVVRAVWGHGRYLDGQNWRDIQTGMTLPENTKVRPFRDSVLAFYNPEMRTTLRVTDHKHQTTLRTPIGEMPNGTVVAAKAP